MKSRLTIVMYHYVRPLRRTRYPEIKGLDLDRFRGQLDFLGRHYRFVGMDDVLASLRTGEALPEHACLLTFDDGYSDHYRYVFPILHERGLSGAFYPPRATLIDRQLLDVNKIHFILASCPDKVELQREMERILAADLGYDQTRLAALRDTYAKADHLDTAEVVQIKHLLQYALPEEERRQVVDALFARFVTSDPLAFAEELYLTEDQARAMVSCGMHFGGHGDRHYWISRIAAEAKAQEIDRTADMLLSLGMAEDALTFCYPYGDWDQLSLDLLAGRGFRAALTTKQNIADLAVDSPLLLPRLDTIDLQAEAEALPGRWTLEA